MDGFKWEMCGQFLFEWLHLQCGRTVSDLASEMSNHLLLDLSTAADTNTKITAAVLANLSAPRALWLFVHVVAAVKSNENIWRATDSLLWLLTMITSLLLFYFLLFNPWKLTLALLHMTELLVRCECVWVGHCKSQPAKSQAWKSKTGAQTARQIFILLSFHHSLPFPLSSPHTCWSVRTHAVSASKAWAVPEQWGCEVRHG